MTGGCQHDLAIRHAIERVVADDEFFRLPGPADQCVGPIANAEQAPGNEVDALRDARVRLRLPDQAFDHLGPGNRCVAARNQQRETSHQSQNISAIRRGMHRLQTNTGPADQRFNT